MGLWGLYHFRCFLFVLLCAPLRSFALFIVILWFNFSAFTFVVRTLMEQTRAALEPSCLICVALSIPVFIVVVSFSFVSVTCSRYIMLPRCCFFFCTASQIISSVFSVCSFQPLDGLNSRCCSWCCRWYRLPIEFLPWR